MSWEHIEYPAFCRDCGHKGSRIYSENDWFRTNVTWIGFEFAEVRTKKVHSGTVSCPECGSSSIHVEKEKGAYVKRDQFWDDRTTGVMGEDELCKFTTSEPIGSNAQKATFAKL